MIGAGENQQEGMGCEGPTTMTTSDGSPLMLDTRYDPVACSRPCEIGRLPPRWVTHSLVHPTWMMDRHRRRAECRIEPGATHIGPGLPPRNPLVAPSDRTFHGSGGGDDVPRPRCVSAFTGVHDPTFD